MEETTMEKLKINNLPSYDADQKLLDDMKKAYMACPQAIKYCNELGIPAEKIEENIVKIYDLVRDITYCSKCPGVKKCAKSNPLLCTRIIYSQGEVDRQMVPCKELLKDITFKKQFIVRDFEEDIV